MTDTKTIYPLQVRITSNWGNERIYPVNETAKTFTRLTRKKTLDRDEIAAIKDLGYSVEVIGQSL